MAITNKSLATGTITNKSIGSAGLTWDDMTMTWNEVSGTWDNPYVFSNKSLNTAALVNKAAS